MLPLNHNITAVPVPSSSLESLSHGPARFAGRFDRLGIKGICSEDFNELQPVRTNASVKKDRIINDLNGFLCNVFNDRLRLDDFFFIFDAWYMDYLHKFLVKFNGLPYIAIFKQRMDGDVRVFSCDFYCSRFHTAELNEVLKIIYPVEHRTPRVLGTSSRNSSRVEAIGILDGHYGTQKQFILKEAYDEIDKRVKRMVSDPDYYRRMNLPRKETFMFYGPPGTGKTTISRHFAVKYGMDVINTVPSDLAMVIRNLQVPTIVVLDDIDAEPELCISEPTPKDANSYAQLAARSSSASYGKFINILDGTMPLSNVVIFMSTNYIKKLRPAIYRKGRVDCIMKLDYMDIEQVIDFCKPDDTTADLVRANYVKGDIVIGMFPELINLAKDFDDWVKIIESHKLEKEAE